jgi:selenocysteine lyase/cysteine desulfurase
LNAAIWGQPWKAGDLALMSGLEHHAVSRPIRRVAREKGVRFEVIPFTFNEPIDLSFVEARLRAGRVRLVACTMASNVTGHILPIRELGTLCRHYGTCLLVDAAQATGIWPVDVDQLQADIVVFAGHKALFGPPGIGGLYVREGVALSAFAVGGTNEDTDVLDATTTFPSSFEVGTHNLMAIAGLTAGVQWLKQTGVAAVEAHERELTDYFLAHLQQFAAVTVYGPVEGTERTGVVSITLSGIKPTAISEYLSAEQNIATRSGFHCAPLAHETIGTLRTGGTTRFSFGFFNTRDEIDQAVQALQQLAALP